MPCSVDFSLSIYKISTELPSYRLVVPPEVWPHQEKSRCDVMFACGGHCINSPFQCRQKSEVIAISNSPARNNRYASVNEPPRFDLLQDSGTELGVAARALGFVLVDTPLGTTKLGRSPDVRTRDELDAGYWHRAGPCVWSFRRCRELFDYISDDALGCDCNIAVTLSPFLYSMPVATSVTIQLTQVQDRNCLVVRQCSGRFRYQSGRGCHRPGECCDP